MLKKDKLYKDYGLIYREYRWHPYKSNASWIVITLIMWCASLAFMGTAGLKTATVKTVTLTTLLFFAVVYYSWKDSRRDRTETIFAICEEGLYAPLLPLGKGRCFIPWREIKSIWIQGYIASYKSKPPMQHPSLFIWLYNNDEYFKQLSILEREFRERDKNVYNTHLYFYLSALDCDPDELHSSLEFYRKLYKKRRVNRAFAGADEHTQPVA